MKKRNLIMILTILLLWLTIGVSCGGEKATVSPTPVSQPAETAVPRAAVAVSPTLVTQTVEPAAAQVEREPRPSPTATPLVLQETVEGDEEGCKLTITSLSREKVLEGGLFQRSTWTAKEGYTFLIVAVDFAPPETCAEDLTVSTSNVALVDSEGDIHVAIGGEFSPGYCVNCRVRYHRWTGDIGFVFITTVRQESY